MSTKQNFSQLKFDFTEINFRPKQHEALMRPI